MITVEVVVQTPDDARKAEQAGASRLELVQAIELGGLTPTSGMMEAVRKASNLPVRAMIRPLSGGFHYSSELTRVMESDILALGNAGADGFVFGCLTDGFQLNDDQNSQLLSAAGKLPCTFHRASDLIADLESNLENLIKIGFSSILTTGGTGKAIDSLPSLQNLVQVPGERIEIIICGGVRSINIRQIIEGTGAKSIHLGPFWENQRNPAVAIEDFAYSYSGINDRVIADLVLEANRASLL